MQLTDVRADRFGSLNNIAVENLSRHITVLYGTNGCGKTTLLRFLRGVLFGFRRNASLPTTEFGSESGCVKVQTPQGSRTLRRSWSTSGIEQFSVTDDYERSAVSRQDNQLPAWVTEDVFREVFSVGYEEADRFDLLTRLCVESGSARIGLYAEVFQAEAALLQAVRDRDGNGVQGGVVHRISELRRRQGELQGEISQLRKPAADVPARIEQLNREIDAASLSIDRIDVRLREIDAEIIRLEQLLTELRRRNVLPLNRPQLEEEIRGVTARLDRWREIRGMIQRETEGRRVSGDPVLQADDSVRSIRAIVARLEERTQALTDRLRRTGFSDTERTRDADVIRQLRGEIAALCQYFGHHERTTAQHIESVQALLADRTFVDASQMERMLEEQLATLRAELSRADNVLAETRIPKYADSCRFSGHQETVNGDIFANSGFRTVAEVETQLQRLCAERSRLASERASTDEARSSERILLERLRQESAGASSLEQLDTLRAQIAELDAEILLLEDQRRQLDRTESSLREVVDRLKARTNSRVLETASQYVRRLTEGECQQISAALPDRLLIQTTHHVEPLSLAQLSRGTRDQVALALRLALIQVRAETQGHVPLILDDVFISSDDARATAAVQLLTEIAQHGQQIVFFTCQKDVRDLFARFHADVRNFGARIDVPTPPIPAPAPVPVVLHAYVEPKLEALPVVPEPVVMHQPVVTPPVIIPPPVMAEPAAINAATNWLFYLETDHGVEDLAGITLGELEALRSAGILTIDDLLTSTVPQLEEATRHKGFQLSVDRLHALRGQAELTTRVPMLRRSDAALLFAAGIRSVEELSRLRPETVYDRVSEFQRSEAGSRYRRGGRLIDRQQSINWARFGQFTRTLEDARQSRSRFSARPTRGSTATPSASHAVGLSVADREPAPAESQRVLRRRRVAEDTSTDDRRAKRLARRRRQVSSLRTQDASSAMDDSVPAEKSGGMRFFLSRTSEVEKAPSIGPRTAEMLEANGVRTVEDFLSVAPDRLAEKLAHRRITPAIIQQWQAQSRLMCQIPELRGHDAQILVACHILTPESLASQKPAEFFAVVEPFSRTKEGERIIRTGRKPDLAEVTEWIQWAANARTLKAA